MDERIVRAAREHMESKSTEELKAIWEKNDRSEFSDEGFEAIRQLLEERGEHIPKQQQPVPRPVQQQTGEVPTHLAEAILVTLFCCLPLGIPAIVCAARVSALEASGDRQGAIEASETAGRWCLASLIGGVIVMAYFMASRMRS